MTFWWICSKSYSTNEIKVYHYVSCSNLKKSKESNFTNGISLMYKFSNDYILCPILNTCDSSWKASRSRLWCYAEWRERMWAGPSSGTIPATLTHYLYSTPRKRTVPMTVSGDATFVRKCMTPSAPHSWSRYTETQKTLTTDTSTIAPGATSTYAVCVSKGIYTRSTVTG